MLKHPQLEQPNLTKIGDPSIINMVTDALQITPKNRQTATQLLARGCFRYGSSVDGRALIQKIDQVVEGVHDSLEHQRRCAPHLIIMCADCMCGWGSSDLIGQLEGISEQNENDSELNCSNCGEHLAS